VQCKCLLLTQSGLSDSSLGTKFHFKRFFVKGKPVARMSNTLIDWLARALKKLVVQK